MRNPYLGLEAIDYQGLHPMGVALERAIEQLREERFTPASLKKINLGKIIKDYTGLNAHVSTSGEISDYAAVMIPDVDKNNPIINENIKPYFGNRAGKRLLKNEDVVEGTVDLKRVRIGGAFTKIPIKIIIGKMHFIKQSPYSVKSTVAIILHEVGHAFTYFEMLGRAVYGNYFMAEGVRRLTETEDVERRYLLLEELEKGTGIEIEDKTALSEVKDIKSANLILLNDMVRHTHDEVGISFYGMRNFEKLADQFAIRMGYGEALAVGLDTMFRRYSSSAYYTQMTANLFIIAEVFLFAAGIYLALMSAPIIGIILLALRTLIVFHPQEIFDDYDKPMRRLKAMRNEMVGILKDGQLTKAMRDSTLAAVDNINEILSAGEDRLTFNDMLATTLIPKYRKAKRTMQLQQQLEDLFSNELFVASQKLATLT